MSTIEVEADVDVAAMVAALEERGAIITWAANDGKRPTVVVMEVTVDGDAAYEALPSRYFERDEDEWSEPDAPDVHDFVRACASGDRSLAVALLPRLNLSDAGAWAGERALSEVVR